MNPLAYLMTLSVLSTPDRQVAASVGVRRDLSRKERLRRKKARKAARKARRL
jgi:hypothetical protein